MQLVEKGSFLALMGWEIVNVCDLRGLSRYAAVGDDCLASGCGLRLGRLGRPGCLALLALDEEGEKNLARLNYIPGKRGYRVHVNNPPGSPVGAGAGSGTGDFLLAGNLGRTVHGDND